MTLRRILAGVFCVALLVSSMAGVSLLSVSAADYAAWVTTHNLERYRGTSLTATERAMYTATEKVTDAVRARATAITAGTTSDVERLRAIHDWVADNIAYDYDFYEGRSHTTGETADEVLQWRRAVCEGISELTMQLCRAVDIPCKTVDGYTLDAGEEWGAEHQMLKKTDLNHVWNEAYVNGRWQILDVTWDRAGDYRDGIVTKGEILHEWFDIAPASLSESRLNLEDITDGTFVYAQAADGTLTLSIPLDPDLTTANIPANVSGRAVVAVGEQAFSWRSTLTTVTLPETVTTLGNRAFLGTGLTTTPDMRHVTAAGGSLFAECRSLRTATIPAHWTTLPSGIFDSCAQLTEVTLPSSITIIADHAFNKCSELSSLDIPTALQQVGKYAFAGTKIALSSLPESVYSIGVRAFSGTQITAMPLSDNHLIHLGERAFENCDKLTSVTLPDTVTAIPDGLFSGCVALESVNIPSRVETIGTVSFSYCQALSALALPEGLRQIGDYAFIDCTSLETLTIPNTVKTIGFEAFAGSSALTSVTLPSGLTALSSNLFRYCTALQAIDIPSGVTEIGFSTFEGCTSLKTIHLPAATTSIGMGAFANCTAIEAFTVAAENPVLQIRDGALYSAGERYTLIAYPPARTAKTFTVPEEVERVEDYAFSGAVHLEEVYVDAPMTGYSAWGTRVFSGCTSLRKLQMVDGVTRFSGRMFEGCTALEELTFPSTLTELELSSLGLYECTALEALTVPEDNAAFYDVDGVVYSKIDNALVYYPAGKQDATYTILDGTPYVKPHAFRNNAQLTAVLIPEGVERIETSAFYGCANLSSVTLPQSLRVIGSTAFAATALSDVTLPSESVQLGQRVFFDTPWWNRQPDGPVYYEDILFDFKGEEPSDEVIVREGTRRITSGVVSMFWKVERLVLPVSVEIIEAGSLPEELLIVGTRGSAAERFAKQFGCRFEDPNAPPYGDANSDGKVNTTDARVVLQYAAGLIDESALNVTAANVDGNDKVNTTDARTILQYAANLIDKFPVEG